MESYICSNFVYCGACDILKAYFESLCCHHMRLSLTEGPFVTCISTKNKELGTLQNLGSPNKASRASPHF